MTYRIFLRVSIKVFGGIVVILSGFFSFYEKVGENDVTINYGTIPDYFVDDLKNIQKDLAKRKIELQNSTTTIDLLDKSFEEITDDNKVISDVKTNERLNKIRNQAKAKQEAFSLLNGIIYDTFRIGHYSATNKIQYNEMTYKKLCGSFVVYCNLTRFYGNLSIQDKIKYQSIIIYLISKIDSFLTTNNKLITTLHSITLRVDGDGLRGYAGAHTISLNLKAIRSYSEFRNVLTHEIGHIIDLGIVKGTNSVLHSEYTEFGKKIFSLDDDSLIFYSYSWISEKTRFRNSDFLDFVSGYAQSDPFEDFAESFNLYLNHHSLFEFMSKNNYLMMQKYMFVNSLVGNNYFFSNDSMLIKLNNDSTWRPWDTTTLSN